MAPTLMAVEVTPGAVDAPPLAAVEPAPAAEEVVELAVELELPPHAARVAPAATTMASRALRMV